MDVMCDSNTISDDATIDADADDWRGNLLDDARLGVDGGGIIVVVEHSSALKYT